MATRGIHPKWLTCFPGGVYRYDDGITPDPEEPEIIIYDVRGDDPTYEERTLSDILTEMGF
jgi:hypothetical protein